MKILLISYLLVVLLLTEIQQTGTSSIPNLDQSPKNDDSPEKDQNFIRAPFPNSPLILTPLLDADQAAAAKKLSKVKLPNSDVVSYSGFFNVNPLFDSNIFFWFFPAVNNHEKAPVLVWLQGGPGASSLLGLFNEHGPFIVGSGNSLGSRNTSWTLTHNVIYIDNPVGAGFSFTRSEEGYAKNECDVANNLYKALQQFFKMFEEYRNNDFYVTGQSYGGKYVPALAHKIHLENPKASTKINMKGMAICSGLSDPISMLDYGDFLYSIGMLDYKSKLYFNKVENNARKAIQQEKYLDAFNLMEDLMLGFTRGPSFYEQQTGFKSANNLLKPSEAKELDYYSDYVQQDSVRSAIHVGSTPFINGLATKAAKFLQGDIYKSVKPWIEELLNATQSYKVLFFNGQLDIIVANVLSDKFIRTLNWKGADEFAKAPRNQWKSGDEIAGYYKTVGQFTQLVVRNAGHSVPGDQPEWGLDLINRFTSGKGFK